MIAEGIHIAGVIVVVIVCLFALWCMLPIIAAMIPLAILVWIYVSVTHHHPWRECGVNERIEWNTVCEQRR